MPSVELREVEIFLVLAEELHFGRTAERLHLTQPRVSQAIRALEAQLGGRLFDRTSRRVGLTPVGKQLRDRLAPVHAELLRAFEDAKELLTTVAGGLRISTVSLSALGPSFGGIRATFRERHPGCQVTVREDRSVQALMDLRRGVPAVRFQLKLPTATFTGRYVQYGCGGFCGTIFTFPFPDCGQPDNGDTAIGATDDGHIGKPPFPPVDGTWAANNETARNDYSYRAPHVLSLAAKRIIATYYGTPPRHSYFAGCSTAGREGLLLAQRHPHDFDGIVVAAGPIYIHRVC